MVTGLPTLVPCLALSSTMWRRRGVTMSLGVLVGVGKREEKRILSIETGEADDKRFAYLPGSGKMVSLADSGARALRRHPVPLRRFPASYRGALSRLWAGAG